jgi:hypothetical protein
MVVTEGGDIYLFKNNITQYRGVTTHTHTHAHILVLK